MLLCNYGVFAQYCGTATTNVSITPTSSVQYSSTYSSGRRAFNFNAVAGNEYTFSTVGETTVDTYLRLYSTGTGGSLLAESDDYFNTQSEITWYCSVSGTYSVLLTRWSSLSTCNALNANARIKYQMGSTSGSTIVSIGNGEGIDVIPAYHYYNYNWSNIIYLKSEINTVGSITKIRFQVDPGSPSSYVATNQKIYMAHTTLSSFPASTVKEQEEVNYTSSNWTLVYDGTITWVPGWVEIVLQTPFPWNNTDNLMLKYENRKGSYSAFYPAFYYTTKTSSVGYNYSDLSYPTADGFRISSRPNIKLAISDVALPVTLINFDGIAKRNYNELNWSTASEIGSDRFEIERSLDGNEWELIGNVNASGYSNSMLEYSYLDYEFVSFCYYRLIQHDVNGKFEIFGPICISRSIEQKYIVKVVDFSGRDVDDNYDGPRIVIYSDGSILRIFN